MKKFLLSIVTFLIAAISYAQVSALDSDPKASESSTVIVGNARFTILTPKLLRMEWSEDGKFEDRATLTFINRKLPVPGFKVSTNGKTVTIKTSDLTLTYVDEGIPFDASNLKVEFLTAREKSIWTPGLDDNGNLMGTTRTLDKSFGSTLQASDPLEKGLLSRDGWAIVDDSKTYLFDDAGWVTARPENEGYIDWYIFAYGHEYKEALADYSKVAGPAPLPPRYIFGYWYSRYWQYSDSELREIVERLRSIDIPVDVLIIDMDWHETWGLDRDPDIDEYGQRVGWTGYTWQKELFPAPEQMFQWANNSGLKTALNLHPASGIQPYEECYGRFCEEYGWNEPGKSVPFHIDDRKWAETYYKTILKPIENQGNTFWWIDWQQWKDSKYNPGLSNTFWLNHVFYNYAKDNYPEVRPFLYHRWGGLGSHRYPLGFSGDTYISWESLEYQPEFTATSANVNYGYWGHDLGGHMFKDHKGTEDPERYTRWLQYGVFSPLYKTHATKHPDCKRYPWLFPDHVFQMVDAFHLRYALIPYIYNAARKNFDTGVAMCYPMYYDYPEAEEAYQYKRQFMFGNDVLATCVATPCDEVTGLATIDMWFPEGNDWYDMATGTMYKGGQKRDLGYTIDENPWYVKAGSIIPMNPSHVRTAQVACDTLTLSVIPGADGQLSYYEDDGLSVNYQTEYAITKVSHVRKDNKVVLTINPREGEYSGMKDTRSYEIRFLGTRTPEKVLVDGVEIPYNRYAKSGQWTYDAYDLAPVVYLKDVSVNESLVVELILPIGHTDYELNGLKGIFSRCKHISEPYKNEQGKVDRRIMLPIEYLKVSQCPNFIASDPQNIFLYVSELKSNLPKYEKYLEKDTDLISNEFKTRLKTQIVDSFKEFVQRNELRAPAYPLVTIDPFTSAWSASDNLYDAPVTHWTGVEQHFSGAVTVDGISYRFLGQPGTQRDFVVNLCNKHAAWPAVYTLEKPLDGWMNLEFDDKSWTSAEGAFGSESKKPNVRTIWDGPELWVRREFNLDKSLAGQSVQLSLIANEYATVYVNGIKVHDNKNKMSGSLVRLSDEAIATLKEGKNVIAAYVANPTGSAQFDVALVVETAAGSNVLNTAEQTYSDVQAMNTHYGFNCGPVELSISFLAPLFLDNLDLVSRPVNYMAYKVRSLDGLDHDVTVSLEASPAWAVNIYGSEATASETYIKNGLTYVKASSLEQDILGKCGDDDRINWGSFYMAASSEDAVASVEESGFMNITFNHDNTKSCEGIFMIGYDDIYSVQYFGENLRPYWNRTGEVTIESQFEAAFNEYAELSEKANDFDRGLMQEAIAVGGKEYAELCALAYRQAISAHKLVVSNEGFLMFLSKENNSNGSIGTVDITYPSLPIFLKYNPELAKALMNHIFHYSESGRWTKPFPAHDIGTYPLANGQTYKHDMPVEEAGNMLVGVAAVCAYGGSAEYAKEHWDMMTVWANYLCEFGLDPENQLCTDDFAGHFAHNANLSIKAIMGIASYARMAEMLGYHDVSQKYMSIAKELAGQWEDMAVEGDHYKLTFDRPGTWSQKYNLVWDNLLNLAILDDSVMDVEIPYYLSKQNQYGLPLDSRSTYSKSDWIIWTASMADNEEDFRAFITPLWKFYNETVDRVPMSDWFYTDKPEHCMFIGRSVVGGYFIKLLPKVE